MIHGPKVLVSGAGALGLCVALTLATRGARVTVQDPAAPGDNASGVAAGMLAPAFEAALDQLASPHFALLMAARDLWSSLAAQIGVDIDRSGTVGVGEPGWLEATASRMAILGAPVERLGRTALEAVAPGLDTRLESGFVCPDDWRISPAQAIDALWRSAQAQGAVFRRRATTDARGFDLVVVATGASRALAGLAPELGVLTPIKGHILRLPVAKPRVIRGAGIYLAPGPGGLAVGATMEPGLEDRGVDPVQIRGLLDAAARLFPELADAPVSAAAGVRAATPDGLPLAGPSGAPHVFVAAGARRNGWLLAPLIAEVVCAYALGGDPGPFATALRPDRFAAFSQG